MVGGAWPCWAGLDKAPKRVWPCWAMLGGAGLDKAGVGYGWAGLGGVGGAGQGTEVR